jgi:PadR family transcriptional regulator PadR
MPRSDGRPIADAAVDVWPSPPDRVPATRCNFDLAPPRRFLYPALLLLVAEEPQHGYRLVTGLAALGLARIERTAVYRALADLERDGLLEGRAEAPTAGSTRRVYALTTAGQQALEAWMSVVARERDLLEGVLQRYWYCNGRRLAELGPDLTDPLLAMRQGQAVAGSLRPAPLARAAGTAVAAGEAATPALADWLSGPAVFRVVGSRSSLVVEARSNVGPIAFSTDQLEGSIAVELAEGLVAVEPPPVATLRARVASLTSGNPLFDQELVRRVEARRYPFVEVRLATATRIGDGNCYQITGTVTMHGVPCTLAGTVTATVHAPRSWRGAGTIEEVAGLAGSTLAVAPRQPGLVMMTVTGSHIVDIRRFGMAVPTMPLFKLYPDVRLALHVEAEAVAGPP